MLTNNEDGYSLGDEELVVEHTPYGDYYVTAAKRTRTAELNAALEALNEVM